jgi:hypothetical protein
MRPIMFLKRSRFRDEVGLHNASSSRFDRVDVDGASKPAKRKLTDEELYLVGYGRDLLGLQGEPMYFRARANRGSQLRRIRATDHCIVCGMPALPGVTAFAHIHMRDLHLSPHQDATRVLRLCWHHHHGCYDQGYISTLELLRAEEIWIENRRRPKSHPRDIALMKQIRNGGVRRNCVWTERRVARRAVVNPDY